MVKRIFYGSILGILTDCCSTDSKSWTDSNVVMVLQTVQCGGVECWETVTGLNWLQCGGKGVFSELCGVSEMCFGTVDCGDAHCYIADDTVRWCGMLGDCYWA